MAYTPPVDHEREPSREIMTRQAGTVAAAVLGSRVLGLIREQVFAIVFGAGRELDAFITAFRIPNLLRDLFAEGALSAAFVTTFSQTLVRSGEGAAWRLAALVINALTLVVGTLTVIGILAAPAIVAWIAPGFAVIPGKTALTIEMTRIMFPFILLVALAAVVMGVLNSRNVFGIPASASSFFNLGSILGGLGCAYVLAPEFIRVAVGLGGPDGATSRGTEAAARAITGMAIGTLLGGALQLAIQLPALRAVGFRYRPLFRFSDPALRRVLLLMGPATLGAAAVQVNVLVNNNFASYLGNGPVSWLNVAFRFMQLPIGLFGVAISFVALPMVSRHVAREDHTATRRTVADALEFAVFFSLPAACGLVLLGEPIIGLIYEHGRFSVLDTTQAARALAAYAGGLVAYAGVKILAPAFYALDDARTPARVSVVSIVVNYALNWTLVRALHFGHVGLALSTSTVATVNFLWLFLLLRRRLGGIEGARLARTFVRLAGAAATMSVAVAVVDRLLAPMLATSSTGRTLGYALRVIAGMLVGVPVFAGAAELLGVGAPLRSLLRGRRRRATPSPPAA